LSELGLVFTDLDRYAMEMLMETCLQQMMARLLAEMKASQAEMKASQVKMIAEMEGRAEARQ
jgi:PHD/YefM family antitoxin component YafN of YafNO toxin-antitoxin module